MIRVAQVVYEPAHSGQSVHVLALAEHLDRRRFELHVCYPAGDEIMRRRLAELGAPGHPWPMQRWWNAGPAWALNRLIRQDLVDIVHVHGQFAGLWARPAARCVGAYMVYTPHTIRVRQERLRRLYQMAEGALGRLTDRIISVSDADRRQLVAAGWAKPERIITIPNGVDLGFWRAHRQEQAAARRQLGWAMNAPAVLQIGRLDGQEAPDDLVKAAELVVREQPAARFYLAGDGPLRPQVEAQVRSLGLGESVILLGRREDVPTLLFAADIVALSSLWEGMPYSLLEAGAAGRPAVCTAVDGSPEVVVDGQTGYVVPPSEPAAMAGAILRLLADPARRAEMGAQAAQRIGAHFDVKAMAGAVGDAYIQLMNDGE